MLFSLLMAALFLLWAPGELPARDGPLIFPAPDGTAVLLRWENLEDRVRLIQGPEPFFHGDADFHIVRIHPGDRVTVRMPAQEMLRIVAAEEKLPPFQPDISISNGSGLWVQWAAVKSRDNRSLLVMPDAPAPYLIRIRYPAHADAPVELGLFLSRHTPAPMGADHQNLLSLPSESVRLWETDGEDVQQFWKIYPKKRIWIRISGPSGLVFENRLVYGPSDVQKERSYRIFMEGEKIPQSVFLFETRPDAEPFSAEDAGGDPLQVLGRLKKTVLKIPEGSHLLRLETTALIYGRFFTYSNADYLLPEWNAPTERDISTGAEVLRSGSSLWEGGGGILETAQRLSRDNTHRDGGLMAGMVLKKAAESLPFHREIDGLSAEMLANHTFYRDLLPEGLLGPEIPFHFFYYPAFGLREMGELMRPIVVAEEQLFDWLAALPSGHFSRIPTEENPLTLTLPPRFAPSILRIALHYAEPRFPKAATDGSGLSTPAEERICLQMDNAPPIQFSFDPASRLPEEHYYPLSGAAGLRALEILTGEGTLDGIFSTRNRPAPLIRAGYLEIPLPRKTRSLRLWRAADHADHGAPLWGALQYRASGIYRMTEPEYQTAVSMLDSEISPRQLFLRALRSPERPEHLLDAFRFPEGLSSTAQIAQMDLVNHWLPLIREIRSRADTFSASLEQPVWGEFLPLAPGSVEETMNSARSLGAMGEWPAALEAFSRAAWGAADERVLADAKIGVVRMLYQLKEFYLADHLLRGMLLFETDEILKARAYSFLEENYQQTDDPEGLTGLYAFALCHLESVDAMADLAGLYAEGGDAEKAVTLGLLQYKGQVKSDHDPTPLLRGALFTEWWQTFEENLLQLDPAARNHYQGLAALWKGGDLPAAKTFFGMAGDREWLEYLEKGEAIEKDLNSTDPQKKIDGARQWASWFFNSPGHSVFQDADHLIRKSAGANLLYSTQQDLYSRAHLTTRENPVVLRAMGPLCLRVSARPLHLMKRETDAEADLRMPLEGWLEITDGAEEYRYPIHRNLPSQSLRIVGDPVRVPGRRVVGAYPVGPGLHEIIIRGESTPLLVQIDSLTPEIQPGILPPPTTETFGVKGISPIVYKEKGGMAGENFGMMDAAVVMKPAEKKSDKAICAICPGSDLRELQQQIAALVKSAEQSPESRGKAIAEAHRLYRNHPPDPFLDSLISRLDKDADWILLETVQQSAGVKQIPVSGWTPQSPALRIRKALLKPLAPEEQMLTQGHLILWVRALKPATIDLRFQLDAVGHIAPFPMTVRYELNDNSPQSLSLDRKNPIRGLSLPIPAGEHALRIGVLDRVENQFVRVRLNDEDQWQNGESSPFLNRDRERTYLVATRETPVQYLLEGPAWVRVDQWRDGLLLPRYHYIAEGWQTLTVGPNEDREYGLFRAFQRTPVTGDEPPAPRIIELEQQHVPPPPLDLLSKSEESDDLPAPVELIDAFRLGGQEDGTWTFAADLRRKKNFQEQQQGADEYAEIFAAYRFYNEVLNIYYSTRALGRFRMEAGPTLGFEEEIDYRPAKFPLNLRFEAKAYLQWIETLRRRGPEPVIFHYPSPYVPDGINAPRTSGGDGQVEGALHLGITGFKSFSINRQIRHAPYFTLFGRFLSMDDSDPYPASEIDPDIYSPYKADHRYGLRIGDTLTYRPWLDTRWIAGASVTGNEATDPLSLDHLTLRAEWKQLARPFRVEAGYRLQRYFEDDDRPEGYFRNTVGLGLFWEGWLWGLFRIEGGIDLFYEMETRETAGGIFFSWDWSQGRGYRDYRAGEIDFLRLRSLWIPRTNNMIYESP